MYPPSLVARRRQSASCVLAQAPASRRRAPRYQPVAAGVLVSLALLGCGTGARDVGAPESTGNREAGPPNIVFLLADDLRYDFVGFAERPAMRTPALDALARRATVFDSAYVTTAICSVSRASILSGQYGRRHGLWGFGQGFADTAFAKTYPALLRDAGYYTGFVGKWGVGPTAPVREGFDFWRGFDHQGTYHHRRADGSPVHLTRLIGEQVDTFLAAAAAQDRPWQLSVSFKAPHVLDGAGNTPAALLPTDPAFDTLTPVEGWASPRAADEAYADYFPPEHFGAESEARKRFETRMGTPERRAETIQRYGRLVLGIDEVVGRLVAELEALDLADNTVIVFTSDHGLYLGEYGFAGKWYGSEPAIRIPLFVYDPRRSAVRRGDYALNIDFAPTMLELASVAAPEGMQGESLVGLLGERDGGSEPRLRERFYYEHLWPESAYEAYPIPSTEGTVDRRYKYMRYFRGADGDAPALFEELYVREGEELENIREARLLEEYRRLTEAGLKALR